MGRAIRSATRRAFGLLSIVALAAAIAVGVSACDSVERTVQVMSDAVQELDRQPAAWETTMRNTIAQLSKERSEAVADVSNLFSSALGQSSNVGFCGADFVGRRVSQRMQAILHRLDSTKPAPQIVPVICNTNPSDKVDAGKTQLVTYYGYDFLEFAKTQKFVAALKYSDGSVANADFGHVAVTHNYQLGVEFAAAGYEGVDRTRGPVLVLSWAGQGVGQDAGGQSALPVIIPKPPEPIRGQEDVRVNRHANSGFFSGSCVDIDFRHDVGGEWTIDRSKGDPGHPGVSQISVDDNRQSRASLRGYNYGAVTDRTFRVDGTICGASAEGPGAIFDRLYRVHLIRRP